MRRLLIISGLVVLIFLGVRLGWPGGLFPSPANGAVKPVIQPSVEPTPLAILPESPRPQPQPIPTNVTVLPVAEESLRLHGTGVTPEEDLQILQTLLEGYRRALHANPSGENAEIIAALRGANSLGIAVLAPKHHAIRKDGQLVDRWGTPYFFHSISTTHTEIRSAGPDRRLWTADDIQAGEKVLTD